MCVMIALLHLVGIGSLMLALVAFQDRTTSRWVAAGFLALGVAALLLGRVLTVYFRYREAFVEARRGARKVAREHRKQGCTGYVPRSREALFIRRLVPGARRREEEAFQRLIHAIEPHVRELAARRERLTNREYGREDASAWQRKLGEFMEGVILGDVDEADLDRAVPFVYRWYPEVRQDDARATRYGRWDRRMYCAPDGHLASVIDRMVAEYMASEPYRMAAAEADELDGNSYELHCAHVLRKCGWTAEVMGGSGDQGADIIAERGRTRVVIQCKKYSKSVGNKAVQEAIGGQAMYRAHAAAVVSNAPFTKGAEELARMTKVLLLHHTELLSLDARLAAMGVLKPDRTHPAGETA
jgi:restriction system protein